MVEIECHVCGKTIKLPQYIDTDDYDGEVVCTECNALLHIKLTKGKLKKRKIVKVDKRIPKLTADDLERATRIPQIEEQKLIEEYAPKLPVSMDDKPPKASSPEG